MAHRHGANACGNSMTGTRVDQRAAIGATKSARKESAATQNTPRRPAARRITPLVTRGRGVPRADDVLGVITKEHVADSVATSIEVYPAST